MSERVSLKDRAYSYLREAIITGALPEGSQHSIYRLADQLGISRTPVREAVLQLAEGGLVTVERNRGVRIHGITAREIRDIFELRLLVEVPAAAFAATQGDEVFRERLHAATAAMRESSANHDDEGFHTHDRALHDQIAATLGNSRLASVLGSLRDVTRAHGAWTGHGARDLDEIVDEHRRIVDALLARDAVAAAEAMERHLVRTGTLLMQQRAQRTGESVDRDWWRRLRGTEPDPPRPPGQQGIACGPRA